MKLILVALIFLMLMGPVYGQQTIDETNNKAHALNVTEQVGPYEIAFMMTNSIRPRIELPIFLPETVLKQALRASCK